MLLNRPGATKIAYVLSRFPMVSEIFIVREMLALERQGVAIMPLALRLSPVKAVCENAGPLAERTIYPPPVVSLRSVIIQLLATLRYPGGYLSALQLALSHSFRQPREAKQMLSSLFQAAYFAIRIDRRVRHIHAHFADEPTTVAWLLAEITGRGYSFSAHARDVFTNRAIALGAKIAEAEFVTVYTEYGRQRLLQQHRLVAEGKLHLIYHGLDVGELHPSDGPPSKPPIILSVGRLVEKKGYPFLLQAASILQARGAEFRLVIVGEGEERENLARMAAGLGLQNKVEFTGALPQREVRELYTQAHVFALASVVAADGDRDGLPNVLLEALAMGIPTVASNMSAIPELIEPHKTGLLAAPGDPHDLADKLEIALYDEEFRRRVSMLGRQKVATYFDVDRSARSLATLFSQVLNA